MTTAASPGRSALATTDTWLLLAFALLVTWIAWIGAPIWDDAGLVLTRRLAGPDGVLESLSDRPFYAWMEYLLLESSLTEPVVYAVHALCWWGLALISCQLCRVFVRGSPGLFPAGLLVLAPILVQTQVLSVACFVWNGLLPVVCGWIGVLLVGSTMTSPEAAAGRRWRVAGGLCIAGVGVLMGEYALGSILAGCCLVAGWPAERSWPYRARLIGSLLAAAAFAYTIFRLSAQDLRDAVDPLRRLSNPAQWLHGAPEHELNALWQLSGGAVAARLGDVTLVDAKRASLAGFLLAAAALWRWRAAARGEAAKSKDTGAVSNADSAPGRAPDSRRVPFCLFASVVAATVPAAATGFSISMSPLHSRLMVAAVPVAVTFIVWWASRVVRQQWLVAVLIGFIAGYSTTIAYDRLRDDRLRSQAIAQAVRAHVSSDSPNTLVVMPERDHYPWPLQPPPVYEYTARMAIDIGWDAIPRNFVCVHPNAALQPGQHSLVSNRGAMLFDGIVEQVLVVEPDGENFRCRVSGRRPR